MPKVLLFTGHSGAGKTTLATATASSLKQAGIPSIILDGDELRRGVSSDLGFSHEDRTENIRRCGELAKLLSSQGYFVLISMIAPHKSHRKLLREILKESLSILYISCPITVCQERDPKGLYKNVRLGHIKQFTGIDDEYQPPSLPDITIPTDKLSTTESLVKIEDYILKTKQFLGENCA